MKNVLKTSLVMAAFGAVVSAHAGIALSAMSSFGGGDGWLAPNEGGYTFMGTANNERGFAYSSATNEIILVSRNGGVNLRRLNSSTGADLGNLDATGITGGTFAASTAGCDADGNLYVANLTTNTNSSAYKVYKYTGATGTAAVFFNSTIPVTGTGRLGDSLDVMGSGANVRIAAGYSGIKGQAEIVGGTATWINSALAGVGDARLGITYGTDANELWFKQTGANPGAAPLRRVVGGVLTSYTLTTGGEMAMDYAEVGGYKLLATVDANSSIVRLYEVTGSGLTLRSSLTNTSGVLAANGNAVGQVKFANINGNTATLYAMSTNQGMQAFTVAVPEPGTYVALAAGVAFLIRRRKK